MTYNPIGWFEIPVADMERAKFFYEKLFGITLTQQTMPGYDMVWFPADMEMKGIGGALMKGIGYEPKSGGTVIYFTCPDMDETIERAKSMGGSVILPKKDIGEWGHIAWISDSEGNTIGLHKMK